MLREIHLVFEHAHRKSFSGASQEPELASSDFDLSLRAEAQIPPFRTVFAQVLLRHIGSSIDLPAEDTNVGVRENVFLRVSFCAEEEARRQRPLKGGRLPRIPK